MTRNTRLSPDDWLRAGLAALTAAGPEALKAEALARQLGTTKGSFYWHFDDVPQYRRALLEYWRDMSGVGVTVPEDRAQALAQVQRIMAEGFGDAKSDAAMRSWALSDPQVAAVMEELDQVRVAYLAGLLRILGVRNPDLARGLYAAKVGMGVVSGPAADDAALSTLLDLVLALR